MGCFFGCNKISNEPTLIAENEKEIEFPSYSSKSDNCLKYLEKDNNLLRYISLIEFVNLLSYFNNQTAGIPFEGPYRTNFSNKDEFLSEIIYKELFQSFIENTILRERQLGEEETTFIEMYIELFNSLESKLKEYYGDENKKLAKKNLLCLGTLFCKTNNISKIKFLFDIFKDENEQIMKSEELNEFLICSFLISSYCLLCAAKNLSQVNPTIPEMPREELELLQNSQLEDCYNLLNYFNKNFFYRKPFTWEEFREKFEGKEGFGWIFSTKGIRQKLQEKDINNPNYFLNQIFETTEVK